MSEPSPKHNHDLFFFLYATYLKSKNFVFYPSESCHKLKKLVYQFCASGGVFLYCLTTTSLSQAQISSDKTLSTDVNTSDTLNFNITGGKQIGDNLFHSFSQFSVPTGGSAIFDNALDVQNIFSRVTGGSISNIDGLIQANGSSNLFLLNPNGIIFGFNAQLSIGGSFISTTANQIDFADGTSFSADDLQPSPLLTVSIPIGLKFRETAKHIVNQSRVENNSSGFPFGLQVQPGKTLALVGGDIFLNGGGLVASGGKIELGSVAGNSFVSLIPTAGSWALKYEDVQNFQDIQLSQGALIDTTGESSGNILLQGRLIAITGDSEVLSFNDGVDSGGAIVLKASESLEVSGMSNINSNAFSIGASGDIIIETRKLIIRDRSFIDTSSLPGADGRGGNLTVNASESVEVDGSGEISRLRTESFGDSNAGDLKVTTQRLILRDGGQINSSTRRSRGNGGSVIVNAYQSLEVSGQGIGQEIVDSGKVVPSGLFSRTSGDKTTGNGGSLIINTGRLSIREGGSISVAAVEGSRGQAGNLTINANSLSLNQGTITAETGKSGGEKGANITFKISDLLIIENESLISAQAFDTANGGNVDIDTKFLIASPPDSTEGSDIIANASEGRGGNINITAQGIFGIEEQEAFEGNRTNDIDASSEFGLDGVVEINQPDLDPNRGLVELPETVIDPDELVAQNPCKRGSESEFVITGRGGLPPSLSDDLSSEATQVGLVEPAPMEIQESKSIKVQENPASSSSEPNTIIPAQGWVFNDKGEVVLVAYDPTVTGNQRLQKNEDGCQAP